jgi:membrane carboxypeptidase/penicillin-binding protein
MQLARIKYDINSRTISGKTTQIVAAFWLELLHSKRDILEAYIDSCHVVLTSKEQAGLAVLCLKSLFA